MRSCYIKESTPFSFWKRMRFLYFGRDKIAKEQVLRIGHLTILHIPIIKSTKPELVRKYYTKWCETLKMMGIKSFCSGNIEDGLLKYYLRSYFCEMDGATVLGKFFPEIIEAFALKKGFSLQECELCIISNHTQQCRTYLEKIIKKVKKVTVYTEHPAKFEKLSEAIRVTYGVSVGIKNKKDKPKYYRRLYINTEKEYVFPKEFFKQVPLLDIYDIYKNCYNQVILDYQTEYENAINELKITKNLSFTAYMEEITGKLAENDYKIINIEKL